MGEVNALCCHTELANCVNIKMDIMSLKFSQVRHTPNTTQILHHVRFDEVQKVFFGTTVQGTVQKSGQTQALSHLAGTWTPS